jgi:FecR protein
MMMSVPISPKDPRSRAGSPASRIPPLLLVFIVFFSLSPPCLAKDAFIGHISYARGAVIIRRPGVGRAIIAVPGAEVSIGDVVRTGKDSAAQVVFSDESFLGLAEGSAMRVDEYSFDAARNRRTLFLNALSGKVRCVVYKQRSADSRLLMKSGSALITSGGFADFVVASVQGATEVAALNWTATVKNSSNLVVGAVVVGANERTVVGGKTPPSLPEALTRAQRKRYLAGVRGF